MQPLREPPLAVLAHRGLWSTKDQQNTVGAFFAAWSAGVGVETDLRDLDGEVVISHDMPRANASPLTFAGLLDAWDAAGRKGKLALNIKSDGLASAVAARLRAAGALAESFVFDMSIPDQIAHTRTTTRVFARWSDLEAAVLTGHEEGLWLDAFDDDGWWDAAAVRRQLDDGLDVVLVSPELHGRPHLPTWRKVRAEGLDKTPGFALCTDHVQEALDFFSQQPVGTRRSEVVA